MPDGDRPAETARHLFVEIGKTGAPRITSPSMPCRPVLNERNDSSGQTRTTCRRRWRAVFPSVNPGFCVSGGRVYRQENGAWAKLFSDRYASENIRMNNVLPGFIDSLPERQEFKDRIPMARYGSVDEVSATISFLASEGSGYITGQNIRVDGGITRSV